MTVTAESSIGSSKPVGRPKIVSRGVTRNFATKQGEILAFGPLDLTIHDGELVCIVGPSGCGKSTFLKIMADLMRPSRGTIEISKRSNKTPTAMVFQDYNIFPWKTVESNVRFGLDLAKVPRKIADAKTAELLSRLGLSAFAKAYPGTLSGGMRQRVAIARALAVEPEVLLMDEPFAALDAQMRHVMQDELLALWEKDRRTLVFVTHSLEEAILLGDRIVVMSARPGKIIADIRVPFERPRSPEIRGSSEFASLQNEVWTLLKNEVQGAIAAATEGGKS